MTQILTVKDFSKCQANQSDGGRSERKGPLDISTCMRDQRKPGSNMWCKCHDLAHLFSLMI